MNNSAAPMETSPAKLAPKPPRKPEPHECCGTGCIPCVMDIYEEELWQYEKDLKAWTLANAATATATAAAAAANDSANIHADIKPKP